MNSDDGFYGDDDDDGYNDHMQPDCIPMKSFKFFVSLFVFNQVYIAAHATYFWSSNKTKKKKKCDEK